MQVVDGVAVDGVDEVVVHVGAAVGAYVVVGAAVVAVDGGACAVVTVVDGGEVVVVGSSAPCSCLCAFLAFDHLSFHALFLAHGPFYSLHQVPSCSCNTEARAEAEYVAYPWVLVDLHV